MSVNILVTSTGGAVGQGIMKSIKNSSLDARIIATNCHKDAAGLYRGDAAYIVPLAKDKSFIPTILEICKREKIDGICIGLDYELGIFAENKSLIESETGAKVLVSSPEVIGISDDKWLTHEFMLNNNFPYIPSTLADGLEQFLCEQEFPLIIKPRIGDSSKDTFIVKNKEELDEKLNYLQKTSGSNSYLAKKVDPIIQKYMGDEKQEFTSTTLVFDGKSYGVISLQREMRFGGHTTKAEIRDFHDISTQIKAVAEKLNPFGPCNLQSRVVDGIPYIFEINARFSGTTATCSIAGFNTVEAAIRKAVLREEIKELSYKNGTMFRYFNEVFVPESELVKIVERGYLNNPQSSINSKL